MEIKTRQTVCLAAVGRNQTAWMDVAGDHQPIIGCFPYRDSVWVMHKHQIWARFVAVHHSNVQSGEQLFRQQVMIPPRQYHGDTGVRPSEIRKKTPLTV